MKITWNANLLLFNKSKLRRTWEEFNSIDKSVLSWGLSQNDYLILVYSTVSPFRKCLWSIAWSLPCITSWGK